MKIVQTCPQGHQWESLDELSAEATCPACGGPATTWDSRDETWAGAVRDELPPPPSPAAIAKIAIPSSEESASRLPSIDGFELQRELGRGGMGVVYQARQLALNRTVAIKMLLSGEQAAPQERLRFQREAQAVSGLRHANIVQVHWVGEQAGRPFLCMEYVAGPTLAAITGGSPLIESVVVRIVRELAEAVQAAHDGGVIHRDLKPGNILLDRGDRLDMSTRANPQAWEGVTPKIADFGLAKRQDDARVTRSGAILGTPSYMAPEQAEGKAAAIGPATDIYALGAILYELLTGRPPHLAASAAETLRRIGTEDPVSPRTLQSLVSRDLETICLRCLEREPRRRYPTARALAEDLSRFERGLPVLARPISSWQRWGKWARRHPTVAAMAGVSGIAVIAILGGWAYFTIALRTERDQARAARERESIQRSVADANFHRARAAVDEFLIRVSQEDLLQQPGLQPLRRELLTSAQRYHEQFLRERGGDPDLRMDIALTQGRIGLIHRELGQLPEALAAFERAESIYAALAKETPVPLLMQRRAANLHDVALIQRMRGQLREARTSYQRSLELDEQLLRELPKDVESRRGMAKTLSNLGVLDFAAGAEEAAIEHGQRGCKLLAEIASESKLAEDQLNYTRGLINHAQALASHPQAELEALKQAEEFLRQLADGDPKNREYRNQWAKCLHNLGISRTRMGQGEEGRDALRQAIELNRRLVADNPLAHELRQQLATSLYVLAAFEMDVEAYSLATDLTDESAREVQVLLEQSPDNPEYLSLAGVMSHQSAQLLEKTDRIPEAIAAYETAVARQSRALEMAPDNAGFRDFLERHRAALKALTP